MWPLVTVGEEETKVRSFGTPCLVIPVQNTALANPVRIKFSYLKIGLRDKVVNNHIKTGTQSVIIIGPATQFIRFIF